MDKAIEDFVTCESMLSPGSDKATYNRLIADVYKLKGDAKKADKYLRKAEAMDPENKK